MRVHKRIEPEFGEEFECIGKKVRCVEDDTNRDDQCTSCAFYGSLRCTTVCCASHEREDMRDVHFVELKDNEETN